MDARVLSQADSDLSSGSFKPRVLILESGKVIRYSQLEFGAGGFNSPVVRVILHVRLVAVIDLRSVSGVALANSFEV